MHAGEPLLWDETCRIKHLPTRMYLAVVGDSVNNHEVYSALEIFKYSSSGWCTCTVFKYSIQLLCLKNIPITSISPTVFVSICLSMNHD